jgi:hypothetical protein
MKNSAKAIIRNGGFRHLAQKFPWISDAKVREMTFISPQMKDVINDANFYEVLDGTKETACEAFLTFEADAKRPSTGSWLRKCLNLTEL